MTLRRRQRRRHLSIWLLLATLWFADRARPAAAADPPANPKIRAVVLSSPGTRRIYKWLNPLNPISPVTLLGIWTGHQFVPGWLEPEWLLERPTAQDTFQTLLASESSFRRRLYLGADMNVAGDGAILFPFHELGWDQFSAKFAEFLQRYNAARPTLPRLTVDDLAFYRPDFWIHGVMGVPDPRAERMHAVLEQFVIEYATKRSGRNQLNRDDLTLVTNYYSHAFMSGLEGHRQFLEDDKVPVAYKQLRVFAICGDPGAGFATIEYRLGQIDQRLRTSATAKQFYPNLAVVLVTGYDKATSIQHVLARPVFDPRKPLPANAFVVDVYADRYRHNHDRMWEAMLGAAAADDAPAIEPSAQLRALRGLLYYAIVREPLPLPMSELLADRAWQGAENPLKAIVKFRSSAIDPAVEHSTALNPLAVYELLAWATTVPAGETEPIGATRALLIKRVQLRLAQRDAAPSDAPFVYTAAERDAFKLVTGELPSGSPRTDFGKLNSQFVTRYALRPAPRPRR